MLRFQLRVLLLGLSASVLLAGGSAAPREDGPDVLLGTGAATAQPDPSRTLLLKIVSDLLAEEFDKVLPVAEELGLRREAVRQLQLSQRERKAGCRNFFWKTFTSC